MNEHLCMIVILVIVALVSAALSILLSFAFRSRGRKKRSAVKTVILSCSYILTVCSLVLLILCIGKYKQLEQSQSGSDPASGPSQSQNSAQPSATVSTPTTPPTSEPTQTPTVPPTDPPPTESVLENVGKTDSSDPKNWKVKWEIFKDNESVSSVTWDGSVNFHDPSFRPYFALPGISTFLGNNYRNGASYGSVNMTEQKMTPVWNREISSIKAVTGSGYWSGCGWTGQPLIVQWDEQTKQIMNLYPEKKAKEGLVEVIYATLDGHIYFYDLEDGSSTREPINIGMPFKGSGSLDPRGYPLLYVGPGDKNTGGSVPRMYVISLIDCSILYQYGNGDSLRYRSWTAFDSSPLIDGENDMLIWPGESGLLYTMKLNTVYDKEAGTISVSPSNMVKTRYSTSVDNKLGYEASAVAVNNYLYIGDNGGMLFCVDMNTMNLVWSQFVKDDVNATPVFQWEDGQGYLYCATSMEYSDGYVYIYKINAATGEIVWEKVFDDVYYSESVSGGVLSSPVLGRPDTVLDGMILYSIAKTPGAYNGILVALDTATGEIVWEKKLNSYCWSTPVAVYGDDGSAYVIQCDSAGRMLLIDPATGETISTASLGSNVEASPAVFNDMLVVGTRGMLVYGVRLS